MSPMLTDRQSLAEYSRTRSAESLAAIVRRHVDLVYATARRLVGDPHLADDITQAAFLVLLRRADQVNPQTLPGWLVNTTRLTAREAIRSKLTRAKHETESARRRVEESTNKEQDATAAELLPLLDDALAQLNDADRTAVVLRFLQGKSFAEVGQSTGATEEAARKRVARAVEKLRAIFMKQGVVPSVGGLMIVLAGEQATAAPAAVLSNAVAAVTSGGSALAVLLAKGAASLMNLAKMKLIALVVAGFLTAVVIGVGVKKAKSPEARASTLPTDPKLISGTEGQNGEVYITGDVQRPGVYSLKPGALTVKPMLSAAGMTTDAMKSDYVQIIRRTKDHQEPIARNLPIAKLASGELPDPQLMANDIVTVSPKKLPPTNVADIYLEAATLIAVDPPASSTLDFPHSYPPFGEAYDKQSKAMWAGNQAAILMAREAMAISDPQWPDDRENWYYNYVRSVANLLADVSFYEHTQGNHAAAVRTVQEMLHMCDLLDDPKGKSLMRHLISRGVRAEAMSRLSLISASVGLTNDPADKRSLQVDAARQMIMLLSQVHDAKADMLAAITASDRANPDWGKPLEDRVIETAWRADTECHFTAVSLACQLFLFEKKRWPNSLEELIPAYLPAKVKDPWGDGTQTLEYVLIKAGLPDGRDRPLVYSRCESKDGLFYRTDEPEYSFYSGDGSKSVRLGLQKRGGQFRDIACWVPPTDRSPGPTTRPLP